MHHNDVRRCLCCLMLLLLLQRQDEELLRLTRLPRKERRRRWLRSACCLFGCMFVCMICVPSLWAKGQRTDFPHSQHFLGTEASPHLAPAGSQSSMHCFVTLIQRRVLVLLHYCTLREPNRGKEFTLVTTKLRPRRGKKHVVRAHIPQGSLKIRRRSVAFF